MTSYEFFRGFVSPRVIWCADFEFGIRLFFICVEIESLEYTLARPTWRRMTEGGGEHCARAVHVQIFCTYFCFAAPTGQTVGTANAKLAGHTYATPSYMFAWLPFLCDAGCARQDRKRLFERGRPALGNFELSTPNLVH